MTDTKCIYDLPEYSDNCSFKKGRVTKIDRTVSDPGLEYTAAQYSCADLSPNCFELTFIYGLKHYFNKHVDRVISISASYLHGLMVKNSAQRIANTSKIFCSLHYTFQVPGTGYEAMAFNTNSSPAILRTSLCLSA
jgi:hypothetical protein